jgi:AcrR family transcriptional regulator
MASSGKPLRVRQSEQVREAIVDAAVGLLESGQAEQVTVPQVAEAAGVSLRTVYRYFPTREELLAAAGQRAREQMGLRVEVRDVEDIVTSWWENSARVAARPELGRALLYTAAGREARAGQRGPRVEAIAAAFAEIGEQLPAGEAERMRAIITYLCGSGAFIAISEESGLSLDEARAAVRWALTTLLDAACAAAGTRAADGPPAASTSASPASSAAGRVDSKHVTTEQLNKTEKGQKKMSKSLTCGPCGTVLTAETEEELVDTVLAHAREHDGTELSREHILAEIRGENPEDVHRRIGL